MLPRAWLHRQLAVGAWPGLGLSPINRLVGTVILLSGAFAVIQTEASLVLVAPEVFAEVEIAFGAVFTIEYVARLYAAGEDPRYQGVLGRLRYMMTPLAIVDLLAVAPVYLSVVSANALLLRTLRLLAMVRFAKLGRYSVALHHMVEAVQSRRFELGLSAALGCGVLVLSATLLYIAEGGVQPEIFGSIPRALWWSIVTLTTVGYGDAYPITTLGRIFAGLTAVTGVGLIAMPTGILAAAFSDVFQSHRSTRMAGKMIADVGPSDARRTEDGVE